MQHLIGGMTLIAAGLGALLVAGCASMKSPGGTITRTAFGSVKDGPVDLYTLRNANGAEAAICTYGGIVVSLKMPDRNGKLDDVVLGFDKVSDYEKGTTFFGALIGRYGNRIADGKFTLDGIAYQVSTNNPPNCLHGGFKGFDKVLWTGEALVNAKEPALQLTYVSKDGEEGFPGTLKVTAIYTLTDDNALRVDFTATTDKKTVVSLTHHSYFNLAGRGDVLQHVVFLNADKFTPVNANLIPTGELKPVDGTPFDFRTPTAIGARINQPDEQLKIANGYDHNWVITKEPGKLGLAARVTEATSGRVLEVLTTEPGVQFYTGNFLDGTQTGKGGQVIPFRSGFCLEPQKFPDSPNHPSFPSSELKPGDVYHSTIIYRFSVR